MANREKTCELSEIYEQWKQEILTDQRDYLVKYLDATKFMAFLRSKDILDEEDEQKIRAEPVRKTQAELFLDMISHRKGRGFDMLCEAILNHGTGQLFLFDRLLESFEFKRDQKTINMHTDIPLPGEPGGPVLPEDVNVNEIPLRDLMLQENGIHHPFSDSIYNDTPPPYSAAIGQ